MRILLRKVSGTFGALIGTSTTLHSGPTATASPPSAALPFMGLLAFVAIALIAMLLLLLAPSAATVAHATVSLAVSSVDSTALLIAGTTLGVYDTAELTGVVNSLKGMTNGIRAKFFNAVKMSESETIAFDIDEKKRYLAPYVHPKAPGKPRDLRGFRTDTFKPAYIKQLTVVDVDKPLKRAMGEGLMGEEMSPEARTDAAVTQELADHREYIDNRLEQQAIEALDQGTVTISGEDYPEVVVNFGRHASLNAAANTLSGGGLWSAATADPLKNFRNWSKKSSKLSGSILRNYIMDSDAYDAFRALESIDRKFNVLRIDPGSLNTNEAQTEGLILRGEVDGHLIWTYDGWYIDDTGTEVDSLAGGKVIGVGQIDGVVHFGAIKDFAAKHKAMPIFAKMKEEWNPSGLHILTQTAPLVVPQRINATLSARVL